MAGAHRRVVGILFALLATTTASHYGCGSDPDTPTPSQPNYPKDEIDGLPVAKKLSLGAILNEPVRVVRDDRGMVHVYGRNLHDTFVGEGYMMARDRAPQMELLRRVAEGRLAGALGGLRADLANRDLSMRAMGLHRTAKLAYAAMKPESLERQILDGFAAGVTAYFREIRNGDKGIPNGWTAIAPALYEDWTGVDSLAIGRLQSWGLSYTGDDEIDATTLFQAARDTFNETATDPAKKARAGLLIDFMRFEPLAKRPVLDTGLPGSAFLTDKPRPAAVPFPRLSPQLLADVAPMLEGMKATRDFLGRGGWSSNNWVISPQKSATGAALVASDPHLGLPAPSIFWMTGVHVKGSDPTQDLDAAGMGFAGIPGVVLGFNKDVAWGATVAVFDVNDAYKDKIVDGKVKVGGVDVAIQPIEETFDYGPKDTGNKIVLEAVPGHGFIMPTTKDNRWVARTASEVLTIRWTGMEPSSEFSAFMHLNRAKNVDEGVKALESFEVGAQNFVLSDSSGNIAYTTHSLVPTRPAGSLAWDKSKASGQLPCLVLPGDGGLEWTGRVASGLLPQAKNPAWGYIGTANSDQYGLSFDNDPSNGPLYLSCTWDVGFREARVRERIDAKEKLSLDDLASIQADHKSPLGNRLTKFFVAALQRAEDARTGGKAAPDLDGVLKDPRYKGERMQFVLAVLKAWGDKYGYETPAAFAINGDPEPSADEITASQATLIFNAAFVALEKRVIDDEWKAMGRPSWMHDLRIKGIVRILEKPEALATADATGESILWDDMTTPDVVETRDQQIVLSLLQGLDGIVAKLGDDPGKWRWGAMHTITFTSMVPGTESDLSIPDKSKGYPNDGFPRHGDWQNVDRSDPGLNNFDFTYDSGPAQRFVASLEKSAPVVRNALPGGNVWRPDDKFFDNEVELWRRNKNAPIAFMPGEVAGKALERWDLVP